MTTPSEYISDTIGADEFTHEIVTWRGKSFMIKEASSGEAQEIGDRAGLKMGQDAKGLATLDVNEPLMRAWALVYLARIPGTGQKIYSEAHVASLVACSRGGFMSKLGDAALRMMRLNKHEDGVQGEAKPSVDVDSTPRTTPTTAST